MCYEYFNHCRSQPDKSFHRKILWLNFGNIILRNFILFNRKFFTKILRVDSLEKFDSLAWCWRMSHLSWSLLLSFHLSSVVLDSLFSHIHYIRCAPHCFLIFMSLLIEGRPIMYGKYCLPAFSIGKQCDAHRISVKLQLPELRNDYQLLFLLVRYSNFFVKSNEKKLWH